MSSSRPGTFCPVTSRRLTPPTVRHRLPTASTEPPAPPDHQSQSDPTTSKIISLGVLTPDDLQDSLPTPRSEGLCRPATTLESRTDPRLDHEGPPQRPRLRTSLTTLRSPLALSAHHPHAPEDHSSRPSRGLGQEDLNALWFSRIVDESRHSGGLTDKSMRDPSWCVHPAPLQMGYGVGPVTITSGHRSPLAVSASLNKPKDTAFHLGLYANPFIHAARLRLH